MSYQASHRGGWRKQRRRPGSGGMAAAGISMVAYRGGISGSGGMAGQS